MELPWKFGGNRRSCSQVISEQTNIHTKKIIYTEVLHTLHIEMQSNPALNDGNSVHKHYLMCSLCHFFNTSVLQVANIKIVSIQHD